jgi:hypothetical protein
MSISRYVLDKGLGEFECHIRDTEDWQDVEDDPIFREIVTNCKLISVEELTSRRQHEFQTHNSNDLHEIENKDVDETKSDVLDADEQTNDTHSSQDGHIDEDTHMKNGDQDVETFSHT